MALDADDAPLALPRARRHILQRRVEAVGVVADVAVVAQQQPTLIGRLAAALADGALQAPPALLQHDLRHLGHTGANRVVALTAL